MAESPLKQRIRLFITVDRTDNAEISIPNPKFVYGFELNERSKIKHILRELCSKLIPNRVDGIRLELYLRHSTDYLIPPWSLASDVLQNGDEVILRIRRISSIDDPPDSIPIERSDTSPGKQKDTKKKKKRKWTEEKEKEKDGNTDDAGSPNYNGKKKLRKEGKNKGNDQESNWMNMEQREETEIGEKIEETGTVQSDAESQRKKKRPKHSGGSETIYDNAIVIRNGNTGKIQHVYFDSSSSPSPVSFAGDKDEKNEESQPTNTDEKNEEPQATKSKSNLLKEKKNKTEKITSRALSKVKTFTTTINEQTTCDRLKEMANGGNEMDISGDNEGVAVVVTEKKTNGKKFGRNRDKYTNESILIKKADALLSQSSISNTPESNGKSDLSLQHLTNIDASITETPKIPALHPTSVSSPIATGSAANDNSGLPPSASTTNSVKSTSILKPDAPIESYPVVKHVGSLRVGDKISYKVMELNEFDCTPFVSDWKIGKLVDFDADELQLHIALVVGDARCDVPIKFRLNGTDEMDEHEYGHEKEIDTDHEQILEEDKEKVDIVHWNEILEAHVIK